MPVTIQLENPCLTAVLDGEIDHHCARSLREEIDQAILDYEPHQLRLDFEKVTFMDSSGIGVLIGRKKTMDLHSGRVQAIHLSGRALQIFEKSGLTRIIELDQQDEKKTCRQTQYFG